MSLKVSLCLVLFGSVSGFFSLESLAESNTQNLNLQERLKASVAATFQNFEFREPWQKKIFEEEVMVHSAWFVKDYRSAGASSLHVVVNEELLKRYFQFYAPSLLNTVQPKVSVFLVAEKSCTLCGDLLNSIRKILQGYLGRRGFQIQWSLDVPSASRRQTEILNSKQVLETLKLKKERAGYFLEITKLPSDLDDLAHADEEFYKVSSSLLIEALQEGSAASHPAWIQEDAQLETLIDESFSENYERLLGNTFTEVSVKWDSLNKRSVLAGVGEEFLIELVGFKDFIHYSKIKNGLQEALKPSHFLLEKKLARGRVIFELKGFRSNVDVKALISSLILDPALGKLKTVEASSQWIKLEIQSVIGQ